MQSIAPRGAFITVAFYIWEQIPENHISKQNYKIYNRNYMITARR